jgi:type III restriction enzyme
LEIRELDYQDRVLARFDDYLSELSKQKARTEKISEANKHETDPDLIRKVPDFSSETWTTLFYGRKLPESRIWKEYSPRLDGTGRTVPNVVLKIPTGGGKTFMAVESLSKIFRKYLSRKKGFVLWIVPNEAIYSQTKRQLTDRRHPYRQSLDVLSGNATLILEKNDKLDARDVEENLCVMLLMLQSSNRENKESLKIFRDRGEVRGFFPPEGEQDAHAELKKTTANLDVYDGSPSYPWPIIKDSLGNALRVIRPVVVLDEGHKAISDLAFDTLYGFNPCFVLELTATPKDVHARTGRNPRRARLSNVLVDVRGTDLDREGMIKMPLNLDSRVGTDWRGTLAASVERWHSLDAAARVFMSETGRYIRPILLVQAERTGEDQRDGKYVHALDVREWLTETGGFEDAEIAIKTADVNDLASPENQDLLSPTNRIRVIITKQALQEGWDCPFAYVLCALAASSNLSAMTQLVGRILRQPHARKTGFTLLDESYILTHHADTSQVVRAIKEGLEADGMGDLVKEIRVDDKGRSSGPRTIHRRKTFSETEIFLPLVFRVSGDDVRPLDYEEDVLFPLEWNGIDVSPFTDAFPQSIQSPERQMWRIRLSEEGNGLIESEDAGRNSEILKFDKAYAARMISDLVPNAWIAREIVENMATGLVRRGFSNENLADASGLIVDGLRRWLEGRRDEMAERFFREEVSAGRIQFRLRADGRNWRMPFETETLEPEGAEQLSARTGGPLEKSLFSPVYKNDFSSSEERDVAVYLDGESALIWWHRNVARRQYSLQGWRKERIFPDFIFSAKKSMDGTKGQKMVVLEMKGDHLDNPDTKYKRDVMRLMTEAFSLEAARSVGRAEISMEDGTTVECDLVLMNDRALGLRNFFPSKG